MTKPRMIGWILFVLTTIPASGQEIDPHDYVEMSLEEILDLELVTATQTYKTAAESPAVITVLTADQIRGLGVTTLAEALDYLPGVQVTESFFSYSMISMRGNLLAHYNNKVLLLIDGHPMREAVNGSFHLEIIPLAAIDHIEVIRGPGSALYGTNVLAGVIQIITKRGGDPSSRSVEFGGGSYETSEGSIVWGGETENVEYLLSFGGRDDTGYPYRVEQDERGERGTIDLEYDYTSAYARVRAGEWTFSAAGFEQTKTVLGLTPVLDFSGPTRNEAGYVDLLWEHPLENERLSWTARMCYDFWNRDDTEVPGFPFDGFLGHENADISIQGHSEVLGGEARLSYTPSERLSLLGGLVYEHRKVGPHLFLFDDDGSVHPFTPWTDSAGEDDSSAYVQALFSPGAKSEVVLGFRFNENSSSGSFFAPRLGLVRRLGEKTHLKFLYGEAYRTPDMFERKITTFNVVFGDPNLKPEEIRTFDIALETILKNIHLSVNVFHQRTDGQILRAPTTLPELHGPSAAVYINAGGEEGWGFEADLKSSLKPSVEIFANYSYLQVEDRVTGERNPYPAEHTINAGLSWKAGSWFRIKPNIQYVSERGRVDSYTLFNLALQIPIRQGFSLWLNGRNLSDEEVAFPENVRGRIPSVPGNSERAVYARIQWRF